MNLIGAPYVFSAVAIVAFGIGWSVNGWRHDATVKSAIDRVRAEEQIRLDELRISLNEEITARLSLAADLAREKANIKIKYRTITQEVPAYAANNTDMCNYDLSPGLIGLLNAAARGGAGYSGYKTEPARQRNGIVPDPLAGPAD